MSPRLRGAAAALSAVLLLPNPARANPTLSSDYARIMDWLTKETAQGLAFSAGSTFDPPNELPPYKIQPDFSLGIGFLPFDKGNFPEPETQALRDQNPKTLFPSSILFPNLTAHVRMGLPERWDVSVRVADMTIPKGYHLTPGTTGDGQSNTIGLSVRKHFLGEGEDPLISVAGNLNHVFGHFNIQNSFPNYTPAPGFSYDLMNTARLDWSVTSFGVNGVASKTYGVWTPFAGLGLNKAVGSVHGKFRSEAPPGVAFIPAEGEATNRPEAIQGRFIFGGQWDLRPCGLFLNGEMKTIGHEAFKTYIISFGVARPFSFWAGSERSDFAAEPVRRRERSFAWPAERGGSDSAEPMRDAPASTPEYVAPRSSDYGGRPPDVIFIQ